MTWSPDNGIHQGFWTDWTRSGVRSTTLTLGPTNTTILTNSLAMFVTLCSIQTWAIIRYLLHLSGPASQGDTTSTRGAQQLILRNTSSALTTALVTIELIWDHRKQAWRTLLRPYTIVFWAAVYAALFTVAGIFSNKAIMVKMDNGASAVLLRSRTCGLWNSTYFDMIDQRLQQTTNDFDVTSQYYGKLAKEAQRSLQYVQQCYMPLANENDMSAACKTLKKATVGNVTAAVAECPFAKGICNSNSDPVAFDTGIIDSHEHLGINAPAEERLTYRRLTTCSVFNDTSRVTGWNGDIVNSSSPPPLKQSAYAHYGYSNAGSTNWTYSISNFASFYDSFTARVAIPYQLDVEFSPALSDPQLTDIDFEPISELAQKDADLMLAFLSFPGMYLDKIDDPWFAAHKPHVIQNPNPLYETRFSRDQTISTMGCVERHNICNAKNNCTGLVGLDQVMTDTAFKSTLTPRQNATFDRLTKALQFSCVWNAIQLIAQTTNPITGATTLIQTGKSGAVLSASVPVDQWKRELQVWQSISMAQLQRHIVLWATGEVAADPKYLVPAVADEDVWYCDNVMVPSSVYQSFSVLAVAIIMVFGSLLIAVGMFIDDLCDCGANWLKKKPPGTNWKNDNMLTLQLQRQRTKGRRRSFFSFRSKSHYNTSPLFGGTSPPVPQVPIVPTPTLNSTRVSSQAWPPGTGAFLSPNLHTSPNLRGSPSSHMSSNLQTSPNLHTFPNLHMSFNSNTSPKLEAQYQVSAYQYQAGRRSSVGWPISIHEMSSLPSKAPTIRIDDSHCRYEHTYPESAPENYYKHQPNSGSPVSKVSQVIDWIKTLHPEHPAYTRGARRSDDTQSK